MQPADAEASIATLTDREKDCLRLVYRHCQTMEIAAELGLSPHTVDSYLRDAKRKLGAPSRTRAAMLLARFEAAPQSLRYQQNGGDRDVPVGQLSDCERGRSFIREERAAFEFDAAEPSTARGGRKHDLILLKLLAIPAAALLLALLAIAVFPMADAFQRLALFIQSLRH